METQSIDKCSTTCSNDVYRTDSLSVHNNRDNLMKHTKYFHDMSQQYTKQTIYVGFFNLRDKKLTKVFRREMLHSSKVLRSYKS